MSFLFSLPKPSQSQATGCNSFYIMWRCFHGVHLNPTATKSQNISDHLSSKTTTSVTSNCYIFPSIRTGIGSWAWEHELSLTLPEGLEAVLEMSELGQLSPYKLSLRCLNPGDCLPQKLFSYREVPSSPRAWDLDLTFSSWLNGKRNGRI